jgi:hypothetical protein
MGKEGGSAETALQKLHEQYNGYKFMETRLTARKVKLRVQIPDIEKTLGVVKRMHQAQVSARPRRARAAPTRRPPPRASRLRRCPGARGG